MENLSRNMQKARKALAKMGIEWMPAMRKLKKEMERLADSPRFKNWMRRGDR